MFARQLVGLIALSVLAACGEAPPERTAEPASPPAEVDAGSSESGAPATAPTLENTHWQLVQVGGQSVSTPADRPDPHFVLFSDEKRAQGFGGCNRMMGPYEHDGDNLKFGALAATKMACDYPGNPEDAFMQALAATVRARIVGDELELYDSRGAVLAKLRARRAP